MTPHREQLQRLEVQLRARKTEERMRAVQMLVRMESEGEPEVQRLLLLALKDRNNYIASLAAGRLADGIDARLLPELVTYFLELTGDGPKLDPGCHVRAALANLFGKQNAHVATAALSIGIRTVQVEAVGGAPTDTAIHLRANCALALAQLRPPDALRDISLLLFDWGVIKSPRPDVYRYATVEARKAAAQALANLGSAAGIVPLVIKLTHPGDEAPELLQECMQALVDLEDERVLEVLEPYLSSQDLSLAAYACLMLARARHTEAVPRILKTLSSLYGNPLRAALMALTTLRTPEAEAALTALTTSDRQEIRDCLATEI